jgi:hypothetical protein
VVCPGCGARALSTELSNEHRVYAPGPSIYHFTAVTVRLACRDCGWGLGFPHTDDPPQQPESAPSLRLAEALASAVEELDLSAAGAGAEALLAKALGGHLGLYGVSIGPAA